MAAARSEVAAVGDLARLLAAAPEGSRDVAAAAVAVERATHETRNAAVLALLHNKASRRRTPRMTSRSVLL